MRSVQALLFTDLGKDLGRAHWVAPLVESESVKKKKQFETRSSQTTSRFNQYISNKLASHPSNPLSMCGRKEVS